MSIEYLLIHRETENPYRLSWDMVSDLLGSCDNGSGTFLLRRTISAVSRARFRDRGLVYLDENGRACLTELGMREYQRLLKMYEEDDHL